MKTKYLLQEQAIVLYMVYNGPAKFEELQSFLALSQSDLELFLSELITQNYVLVETHFGEDIYWVNESKLIEILSKKAD